MSLPFLQQLLNNIRYKNNIVYWKKEWLKKAGKYIKKGGASELKNTKIKKEHSRIDQLRSFIVLFQFL